METKVFAIHPGEILRVEFMEPMSLTPSRLAEEIGLADSLITDLLTEKCGISADLAERLGTYFELPAQFWMNLQTEHDSRLKAKS